MSMAVTCVSVHRISSRFSDLVPAQVVNAGFGAGSELPVPCHLPIRIRRANSTSANRHEHSMRPLFARLSEKLAADSALATLTAPMRGRPGWSPRGKYARYHTNNVHANRI
jgi:hypothetical protein